MHLREQSADLKGKIQIFFNQNSVEWLWTVNILTYEM